MTNPNRVSSKFPYGHCIVCDGKVVYPGLDGYKCVSCGWIKNTSIALLLRKRNKDLAKAHKTQTSPSRSNLGSSISEPEISLASNLDSS